MAITEILRPNAGSYGNSNIITHPSTVSYNDIETLINEEVADEDSTYVETNSILANVDCAFSSELLYNNYSKIISVCVVCKVKTTSPDATEAACSLLAYENSNGGRFATVKTIHNESISTEWEDIQFDFEKADVIAAIETIPNTSVNSYESPLIFRIVGNSKGSSSTKSTVNLNITQVYVEITYEDDSSDTPITETIYLKENDSWVATPCQIYQKQNSEWILTDSSIFEDGTQFILQEVV